MIRLLRVSKLTDRQILRLIDEIHQTFENEVTNCNITINGVSAQYGSEVLNSLAAGRRDLAAISSFDVSLGNPTLNLRFRRGVGGTETSIDTKDRIASPYFDEIGIQGVHPHSGSQSVSPERLVDLQRLVQKHISLPADTQMVGAASEAVDLLKAQFSQLNEQLTEINTHSLKRREELEDEYAEKRRLLDDELTRHAEQLREEASKLDADYKLRLEAIEGREKQLDDRDHIHARRELRTHITDAIAEQLRGDLIPPKTTGISRSVLGLLLLGGVGLGAISAWSLYEFGQLTYLASLQPPTGDNAPAPGIAAAQIEERAFALAQVASGFHWLILVRGFVSGAIAIGFLLYAISWLKALYLDEVRTRRELQRYATDLSRASWAIETIMEAKASGDVVIPDAVITSVTHNLFESPGSGKSTKETSANALAELLRTSGKARFGPDGAEFELTSRGANRLADKID